LKRIILSQRESSACRASWEVLKTSGMWASIDAVEAASEGEEGDVGEVGSARWGESRIT